ncbi:MAG: T9SS type A sorting domain-containing protein [Bacteroidia bacterium]|nr:T9SS type A sorting domain-containing protein [Bacteroidia bacterium]
MKSNVLFVLIFFLHSTSFSQSCPAIFPQDTALFSVPFWTSAFVTGDFNTDGLSDLAYVNRNDGTLSVRIGNGNLSFQPEVNYATQSNAFDILTDDFNNDLIPDLAVTNPSAQGVSVLLGNGNGTFQAAVLFVTITGNPYRIASGDVNGDGNREILYSNLNDDVVALLPGNGNGTFQLGALYFCDANGEGLTCADFNGDGRADVVVANNPSNSVSFLAGNGNNSLQSPVNYSVSANPLDVATEDIDLDGIKDLLVVTYNNLCILKGNGNGTFQNSISIPTQAMGGCRLNISDLNSDGFVDIVIANSYSADVSVFPGNGTVNPSAPVVYSAGAFISLFCIDIADFDQDSYPDIAYMDLTNYEFHVLRGNGTGVFPAATNYQITGGWGPRALATADLNGDGNLDLVTANQNTNNLSVMYGSGSGTFQSSTNYSVGTSPFAIISADLEGDGDSDLVVTNEGSANISILLNSGTGIFAPAVNYSVGTNPRHIAVADFDTNGIRDIAVTNIGSANVSVLLGLGSGLYASAVNFIVNAQPDGIAASDFDGDSILDLFVVTNYSYCFLKGIGNGSFAPSIPTATTSYRLAMVYDFNQDSIPDVACNRASIPAITIFLGQGNGTFLTSSTVSTFIGIQSFVLSDLNGDLKPDFVVAEGASSQLICTVLNLGNLFFSTPNIYRTDSEPYWIAPGDFNGDYKNDIAAIAKRSNTVSVLLNNTPNYFIHDTTVTICAGDSFLLYGNYYLTGGIYYDSMFVAVNGCDSLHFSEIEVIPCTGISDSDFGPEMLRIFPNPANDWVTVLGSGDFNLFDMTGNSVLAKRNVSGRTEICVSSLCPGIYVAELISSSGVLRTRLIRN